MNNMSQIDSILNGTPTYVFEGIEVKLTGRRATKRGERGLSRNPTKNDIVIVEVVAVDTNIHGEAKHWTEMSNLFVIGE